VARICDICAKGLQRGNKISHAHNVSRRVWNPNLQNVRALVNGRAQQMKVCTRCLKAGKVTKAVRKTKAAPKAEVIDFAALLEKSLAARKGERPVATKTRRKGSRSSAQQRRAA